MDNNQAFFTPSYKRTYISLFAILAILASVVAFTSSVQKQQIYNSRAAEDSDLPLNDTSTSTASVNEGPIQILSIPNPITKKVLVINYNPLINGVELSNYSHSEDPYYQTWNDPIELQNQYISELRTLSHGNVDYQIVETKTVRDYPRKSNGYKFTNTEYLNCVRTLGSSSGDCGLGINYPNLINEYGLCSLVNSGDINEVWLWGGPFFGYFESIMAGPGAFFTNANPLAGTSCTKDFHIMGFNYQRNLGTMLHSFGHRTEGTLNKVFGEWEKNLKTPWNRYSLLNKDVAGKSGCGNIHFPPNGLVDYEYSRTNNVNSRCEDWSTYPSTRGSVQAMNCQAWGCTGAALEDPIKYYRWWFTHLPYKTGTRNNKLNNWWAYVVDYTNSLRPVNYGEKWYSIEYAGSGDYNKPCSSYGSATDERVYIGTKDGCRFEANFVFEDIRIPADSHVRDAYLEFVTGGSYSNPINENILVTNGVTNSGQIPWTITESWGARNIKKTPSLKNAVQRLVSSDNWDSNRVITIRISHASGSGERSIFSWNNEPNAAARIVIFTAKPPSVPTLISPINNQTTQGPRPTFKWNPSTNNPSRYHIQIARDLLFTNKVHERSDLAISPASYYLPVALTSATPYYWRIRSGNSQGDWSNWSSTGNFRTP